MSRKRGLLRHVKSHSPLGTHIVHPDAVNLNQFNLQFSFEGYIAQKVEKTKYKEYEMVTNVKCCSKSFGLNENRNSVLGAVQPLVALVLLI